MSGRAKFRRRNSGFRQASEVRLDRGALPAHRVRQLRVAEAWQRAVGEPIARRTAPPTVRRGILEIELIDPDPTWRRTLDDLLVRVAGRLAVRCPDLKIRKVRLVVPGEPPGEARPVEASTAAGAEGEEPMPPAVDRHPGGGGRGAARTGAPEPDTTAQRLRAAAERYLQRRDR